jgi:hypothetical protein
MYRYGTVPVPVLNRMFLEIPVYKMALGECNIAGSGSIPEL